MSKHRDEDEQQSTPEPESLAGLEKVLTHFVTSFEESAHRWEAKVYPFVKSFEATAKRWERMVYPSIAIFGILGISGFYLIYSLTQDMHELARNVDPRMERNLALMSANMSELSRNVAHMTTEVRAMKNHIAHLDSSIGIMQGDMSAIATKLDTLPPLLFKITEMNESMKAMTVNTGVMGRDMGIMNQNVGRPMSFMNSFAPW